MNKTRKLLTALAAAALVLCSCDKIDKDERYIDGDKPELGRNVLVEEYTGQFCINCPEGHAMMNKIMELYGTNVVAVSIHAGPLAWDDMENGGLMTPEGNSYAANWNVKAYPSIVVNRSGNVVENISSWQDEVQKKLKDNVDTDITLSASISDGKITVKSTLLTYSNMDVKYQIWITESNIVAFQQNTSAEGYDLGYVHNHVYRAAVNGIGGENIKLESGVYYEHCASIPTSTLWNEDNLSVVAFIYDNSGVIQVAETKVER